MKTLKSLYEECCTSESDDNDIFVDSEKETSDRKNKKVDFEQELNDLVDAEYENVKEMTVKQLYNYARENIKGISFDTVKKVWNSINEDDSTSGNNEGSAVTPEDELLDIYEYEFPLLKSLSKDELYKEIVDEQLMDPDDISMDVIEKAWPKLQEYRKKRINDPKYRSEQYEKDHDHYAE